MTGRSGSSRFLPPIPCRSGVCGNKFLDTLEYERTISDAHRGVLEDLLSRNVFDPIREKAAFKEVCKKSEKLC